MTAIALHEATIRRMSLEEALRAADGSILSGDEADLPFPKWVRINFLKERFASKGFGYSDHSIMSYRAIAFEEVAEYHTICLARYPDYWADLADEAAAMSAAKKAKIPYPVRKKVKPDILPLCQRQAEIVEEIAALMAEWQDHLIVRDRLNRKYDQPK
jgi:hypothetical protein